jgi:hypothetical protein
MPTIATVWPAWISARWKMLVAQPRGSPSTALSASESGSLMTAFASAMSYSACAR